MANHRYVLEQILFGRTDRLDAVDPDASVLAGNYLTSDAQILLDQAFRRVERLSGLLESVVADQMDQEVTDADGRPVGIRFVACNALHEGVHHLGDINRLKPRLG